MSNAKKKVTVPKPVIALKKAANVVAKKTTVRSSAVKKGSAKTKAAVKSKASPQESLAQTIIGKLFASPVPKVSKPAPAKKVLLQRPTPTKAKAKLPVASKPKVASKSPAKTSGKSPVKFIKIYR